MNLVHIKNKFTKGLVVLLIVSQLAFSFTFLLAPKPAEAVFGIGDITFNTQIGNIWQILKDIGLAIAEKIALNYANKYLQKFTSQVIDKYRIKDYLAYDKVLSGYYLNQFIYKNVDDPDLRAIYGILATDVNTRVLVGPSGVDCNTSPIPPSCKPALVALQQKLDSYYYNQGGINSSSIYYPGANVRDEEYFQMAEAYFSNPPSFTQQDQYGQFGQMIKDSQSASEQEIASGSGTKNDRSTPTITGVLPHVCADWGAGPYQPDKNPRTNEANCTAAGGTWKVDPTGTSLSVIQNPAAFIKGFADNAIQSIFTNNLHMGSNIYTAIGSLLGNFIFNKINLDSNQPGSVFNEAGDPYKPDNTIIPGLTQVDIDGDGIPDLIRGTGGQPDSCIYGGISTDNADGTINYSPGPPCKGSKDALTIVTAPPAPIGECSPVPTAAQTQEAQAAIDFMTPLLNAIPMNPVVSPPPADYQAAVENIVSQSNAQFPGAKAVYTPYVADNVIAMVFNYIGGPVDHPVSVQDPQHNNGWINAWRVTCTTPPGGAGAPVPPDAATKHPNHANIVAQVKQDFLAANPSETFGGSCGALKITREVAVRLDALGEDAGLLNKTAGNNCNGFAPAWIIYRSDGYLYKVLGDASADGFPPGGNNPEWVPDSCGPVNGNGTCAGDWRAP